MGEGGESKGGNGKGEGRNPKGWLTPHVTNAKKYHACVLLQLIRGGDADAIRLLDDYDWYIAPMLNPDGYSFTFTHVCTPALFSNNNDNNRDGNNK